MSEIPDFPYRTPFDDVYQICRGNWVRCRGCGADRGIFSVALTGDEKPEPGWPQFPHAMGDCPVCEAWIEYINPSTQPVEMPVGMRGSMKERYRRD